MRGALARSCVPSALLPLLRWAFLALCLLQLAGHVPQLLLAPERGISVRAGAAALMVVTGAWWVRCYRRGGFPLPGIALEAAALVAVAVVLGDPLRAVPLAFLASMFRALYRQLRRGAVHVVVVLAVLVGTAVVRPLGGVERSVAEIAFAFAGIPAFMAVMHLTALACTQAEEAVLRGRLVAQSGLDIARAVDEGSARAVSRATTATLLADVPGARARLLAAGSPPPGDPARAWQDFPVPITPDDQRVVRVVSDLPLPGEVAGALAVVATQLALALAKSVLTDDLARRAGEDPLTGLLNRRRLDEVMTAALENPAQGPVAVLTLDLDRFKQVNDAHGHAVGDALLGAVASRLRSHVRAGDAVARLGGDEFLVLLTGGHAAQRAPDLARRLLASVSAPFEVVGRTVRVGASVGVAVAAPDQGPDEVMRASDDAMYRAKHEGRGRVVGAAALPSSRAR